MALSLTTTFTPSAYCTHDLYYYNASCSYDGTTTVDPYSCGFYHLGPATSASACLPSSWNQAITSYYQEGVCPEGYVEACKTGVVDAQGEVSVQATCCPSGYACQTGFVYPWFSTDLCSTRMAKSATMSYTESIKGKGWVTYTTLDSQGFNAFGIPIQYPSTSASASASSASAAPSSVSANPTASSTSSATSSAPATTSSSSSGGLSSGAKIGIGVGVGVGGFVVIAALVAAFFLMRRKKEKHSSSAAETAAIFSDHNNAAGGAGGGAPGLRHDTYQQQSYKPPVSYPGTPTPYSDNPGLTTPSGYAPSSTSTPVASTPTPSELGVEMGQMKPAKADTNFIVELPTTQEEPVELPAAHH